MYTCSFNMKKKKRKRKSITPKYKKLRTCHRAYQEGSRNVNVPCADAQAPRTLQ